ncbi:hypothetical protein ACWEQU_16220 [Streptomyces nodosus]
MSAVAESRRAIGDAAPRGLLAHFAVLQSLGIEVKTRLSRETGDVIGYSLAAPGEPVWYGGSKLAPDLSIDRLRERKCRRSWVTMCGSSTGLRPLCSVHASAVITLRIYAHLRPGEEDRTRPSWTPCSAACGPGADRKALQSK